MASVTLGQFPAIENRWAWRSVDLGERIAAGFLLLALGPILLAIWIAMALLSGRPALIAHRRVGRNGADLWVLKFRTMWGPRRERRFPSLFAIESIDDETGPAMKSEDDPRVVSRFARFCRRHSLDELPQLVHVLRGEMSLVGPRPVTVAELSAIYGVHAEIVLRAKPGLSGLWQVSGRNRLTAEERCRLDLECIRRRSLGRYFQIVLRTIPEILWSAGAW